jgi:hypothetical protein
MNLEEALSQFDAVDANLGRLEKIWADMQTLIPINIEFIQDGPTGRKYQELARAYAGMLKGLPPIGDFKIEAQPLSINEIAHARLDARGVGEPDAIVSVEEIIDSPGREIDEYRFRFNQARAELVRDRMILLMREIDVLLAELVQRIKSDTTPITDEDWDTVRSDFREIERLAGGRVVEKGGWGNLFRHLHWGQGVDLHDIFVHDWPPVRSVIESNLYSELEPLPIHVEDLASLVKSKPTGRVATELHWDRLTDESFERLVFNIVAEADDYRNPQWLMRTHAPDRGRDISVDRLSEDTLSGTRYQRVILQVRHWLTNSLKPDDIASVVAKVALWEPPLVNVLVLVTSGRFTSDAVSWVEHRNNQGLLPLIEMWPESHLELLLAQRPHLIAGFNLR